MRRLRRRRLAHTVLFIAFTVGIGLVGAVAPLAAQAYGAREPRMVRRSLRVGLWAAFILGVPLTLLQFRGADILIALGPDARVRRARGPLSRRRGLDHPARLDVHRAAQLHGRREPSRARPVDYACRHTGQRGAGLWPDLRRLRPARARPAGRRPCHGADQRRHVRRRDLDRLHAPSLQEIPRARARLATGLAAVRQARDDRPADLGRPAAGVRAVRGGGAAHGPHQHDGGCRTSDSAADGRRPCTWCRSASRWPQRSASARPWAAGTRSPRAAPASSPSASALPSRRP